MRVRGRELRGRGRVSSAKSQHIVNQQAIGMTDKVRVTRSARKFAALPNDLFHRVLCAGKRPKHPGERGAGSTKKSFSLATFLLARIANMPASVQTDRSSAPVAFGQSRAMRS